MYTHIQVNQVCIKLTYLLRPRSPHGAAWWIKRRLKLV